MDSNAGPSLARDGEIFILDLGDGDNLFSPTRVAEICAAIKEVSSATGPRALVTKSSGRVWASGLDLDYMQAHPTDVADLLRAVHDLLAEVLAAPVPTIAAMNGHAFAAGAMLAVAHDHRLMQDRSSYFCLPEIDLRIALSPGMSRLLSARLARETCHDLILTGRRYEAAEAYEAGLVRQALSAEGILGEAVQLARGLAHTASVTLGEMKETLYADVLTCLRDPASNAVPSDHFAYAFRTLRSKR